MLFIAQDGEHVDAFIFSRPLDSKFLPGYTIEILISKALAKDTLKRTTMSLCLYPHSAGSIRRVEHLCHIYPRKKT